VVNRDSRSGLCVRDNKQAVIPDDPERWSKASCRWMSELHKGKVKWTTNQRATDVKMEGKSVRLGAYKDKVGKNVKDQVHGDFFAVTDSAQAGHPDGGISSRTIFGTGDATEDFGHMISSTLEGRSIIVFGYGYSGTGITTTIFGLKSKDEGLLKLSARSITNEDSANVVEVVRIELYGSIDPSSIYDQTVVVRRDDILAKKTHSEVIVYQTVPFDLRPPNYNKLDDTLAVIQRRRTDEGRIRCTPNNPESSRDHLFVVLRITNKRTSKVGYLTFCDMGGIENPHAIAKMMYVDSSLDNRARRERLALYLRGSDPTPMLDVLKNEGYFLSETLNHLKYYFREKLATLGGDGSFHQPVSQVFPMACVKVKSSSRVVLYDVCWTVYHDLNLRSAIDAARKVTGRSRLELLDECLKKDASDPVRMLRILHGLDALDENDASQERHSKFVMLCMLNPLAINASDNMAKTLRFAHEAAGYSMIVDHENATKKD
jgi:hypothetical protein